MSGFISEYEAMGKAKLYAKFKDLIDDPEHGQAYSKQVDYFLAGYKFKKPQSAAQLEALICSFLELKGHQAQKITTTGIFRDDKKKAKDALGMVRIIGTGKWTPGTATRGAADITSTIYGLKVDWEIKFSKSDKQSDAQIKFQAKVTKAGGAYFVVRNVDDFYIQYNEFLTWPQTVAMKGFFEV
jgi:hypothetical protein